MPKNIVQLNNRFIQDENQRRRYVDQYSNLQEKYQTLSEEKVYQSDIAAKLKDDSYAAKYARAKYSFSKEGEYIYTIPDLLPQ